MENLYIQSFVTAQQAFEAAQLGKNVVCRHLDSDEFDDLEHLPATIFFKPNYEFAIALQTKILNNISFTIPVSLDEVEQDQEIYLVEPSSIKKVKFQNQDFAIRVIKNGFAQRDEKNAHAQLQAICASFGIDADFEVEEIATKTKRTARKTEDKPVVINEIETDSEKLYEKFAGQINTAEYDDDVAQVKQMFMANSHLSDKHLEMLKLDFDRRIAELNGSVETEVESHTQLVVDQPIINEASVVDDGLDDMISTQQDKLFHEVLALIQSANTDAELKTTSNQILVNSRKFTNDELVQLQEAYKSREELLKNQKDLIDRASSASSVAEANALVKYTTKWSEADRKPVLDAINARLIKLAKPDLEESSLLVRIQSAESVEELEKLESEIENCDPFIQERMYQYYNDKKEDLRIPF